MPRSSTDSSHNSAGDLAYRTLLLREGRELPMQYACVRSRAVHCQMQTLQNATKLLGQPQIKGHRPWGPLLLGCLPKASKGVSLQLAFCSLPGFVLRSVSVPLQAEAWENVAASQALSSYCERASASSGCHMLAQPLGRQSQDQMRP